MKMGFFAPLEALPFREKELVNVCVSDNAAVPDELIDSDFLADCLTVADDSVTLEQVRSGLAKISGSMAEQIVRDRDDRI